MKIIILCRTDYTGSAHHLCHALQRCSQHDVEIWTGWNKRYRWSDKRKHYTQENVLHPLNKRRVQRRIDESDIIHVKGDWPAIDRYMGLRITHKPTIQMTSGQAARKKEYGGRGDWPMSIYRNVTVKTSVDIDLLYPDYGDIWIPLAIDSAGVGNRWRQQDPPILMHAPSNRVTKNTAFILKVFELIHRKMKVETVLLENMTFTEVMEQKKNATIYFDQFMIGFYGNALIEAAQYGIPCATWISRMTRKQGKGQLKDCPIISYPLNPYLWANNIVELLNTDMSELSRKTKEWCDDTHSYQAVARRVNALYKSIL